MCKIILFIALWDSYSGKVSKALSKSVISVCMSCCWFLEKIDFSLDNNAVASQWTIGYKDHWPLSEKAFCLIKKKIPITNYSVSCVTHLHNDQKQFFVNNTTFLLKSKSFLINVRFYWDRLSICFQTFELHCKYVNIYFMWIYISNI